MANVVEIEVRTVDKTDFRKVESDARASGERTTSAFRRIGESAGGILVAGITQKLGEFASRGLDWVLGGIDLASGFNESLSKVQTIFGESAGEIEAWADTAADSIGLAEGAALDAAGTFGNLFDQLGFAKSATADMSTEMVNLAADFASFHNADITDVIDAQTAAFRGEYDALQRFVPTINAAVVEQKALAMTGKAAASELTAQDKAAAVYAFTLENAGQAMGDFARTADSTANAQRRAGAAMTDLQTDLGQRLLPAMDLVNQGMLALADAGQRYLLPALDRVGQFISDHESQFRALGEVISGVATAIGEHLGGVLDQLDVSGVEALAIIIGVVLAGAVTALGLAAAGAALVLAPLLIVLQAIVTVIAGVRKGFAEAGEAIRDLRDIVPGVDASFGLLGDALGLAGEAASTLFGIIRDGVSDSSGWADAVKSVVDGMSIDPDTLNSLTQFADQALSGIDVEAANAAASVEQLEAELEQLLAQISEMAGAYDTTAIFRRIEADAASLTETAAGLEGQVYSTAFGFDRTTEAGRSLESGMEGLHGEVLTLAEQFVNGEITAGTFTQGQQRVQEVIRAVAGEMKLTEAETQALIDKYSAVPTDVSTRVALVDQATAQLDNIAGKIDRLPSYHGINVTVVGNALSSLSSIASKVSRMPSGTTIRRASGGSASGVALVGEEGEELVDLPTGSFVHSAPATEALRNGNGGGATIINHLYFAGSLRSDRDLEEIIADLNRRGGAI